jgi:hypothetical protein
MAYYSRAWWHTAVIPALRRLRQEPGEFRASMGNTERLCLKANNNEKAH